MCYIVTCVTLYIGVPTPLNTDNFAASLPQYCVHICSSDYPLMQEEIFGPVLPYHYSRQHWGSYQVYQQQVTGFVVSINDNTSLYSPSLSQGEASGFLCLHWEQEDFTDGLQPYLIRSWYTMTPLSMWRWVECALANELLSLLLTHPLFLSLFMQLRLYRLVE